MTCYQKKWGECSRCINNWNDPLTVTAMSGTIVTRTWTQPDDMMNLTMELAALFSKLAAVSPRRIDRNYAKNFAIRIMACAASAANAAIPKPAAISKLLQKPKLCVEILGALEYFVRSQFGLPKTLYENVQAMQVLLTQSVPCDQCGK